MTRMQHTELKNLWNANANQYEFYELAKRINPDITFQQFDKGWQYRTVLDPKLSIAREEFLNILNGCY
jgi:hypothetical protein